MNCDDGGQGGPGGGPERKAARAGQLGQPPGPADSRAHTRGLTGVHVGRPPQEPRQEAAASLERQRENSSVRLERASYHAWPSLQPHDNTAETS
ncbi:hypothetical protein P7K49_033067 [Saguinus oedipus]|uniref:Uncharacterized protein n=1 Tax=Saguinus oedipus TaxID=9490 RepID=A0ABQ9TRL8_SAGOE|nr:hypothetical protein P7K49_033067 [Saguinus oedipus]